jgi:SAM-dependent methyltransferase
VPEPLDAALAEVRALLLDEDLVRAVAAGRRRNTTPRWTRVELRPVALRDGRRLQVIEHDGVRPLTRNVTPGESAVSTVEALLAEPFANWYVRTAAQTLQLRVTKRGQAQVHRAASELGTGRVAIERGTGRAAQPASTCGPPLREPFGHGPASGSGTANERATEHDRAPEHLLGPEDQLFQVIGGSAAKRRQVDAFLRALAATLDLPAAADASRRPAGAHLPGGANSRATGTDSPVADELPRSVASLPGPLRVVDLGCGNAYLTFAAYRYLAGIGLDVRMTGVDVREDQRVRNTELAGRLGWSDRVDFRAGAIRESTVDGADLVLALHACDTATDDALAEAVRWQARWILAAPCCHHDIAAQLRRSPAPAPYEILTRHGILRERFADVLTDALRAALLRLHGYRVEVVEFVDSAHTPRNLLLRASRTGAPPTAAQRAEYRALVDAWQVRPHLAMLLAEAAPGDVSGC